MGGNKPKKQMIQGLKSEWYGLGYLRVRSGALCNLKFGTTCLACSLEVFGFFLKGY